MAFLFLSIFSKYSDFFFKEKEKRLRNRRLEIGFHLLSIVAFFFVSFDHCRRPDSDPKATRRQLMLLHFELLAVTRDAKRSVEHYKCKWMNLCTRQSTKRRMCSRNQFNGCRNHIIRLCALFVKIVVKCKTLYCALHTPTHPHVHKSEQ